MQQLSERNLAILAMMEKYEISISDLATYTTINNGNEKHTRWGIFSAYSGSCVVPVMYDSIICFGSNMFWLQKDAAWSFVRVVQQPGNEIVEVLISHCSAYEPFTEYNKSSRNHEFPFLFLVTINGKCGLYEPHNSQSYLVSPRFIAIKCIERDGNDGFFYGDLFYVETETGVGVYSASEQAFIVEPIYERVEAMGAGCSTYRVFRADKVGIYCSKKRKLLVPLDFFGIWKHSSVAHVWVVQGVANNNRIQEWPESENIHGLFCDKRQALIVPCEFYSESDYLARADEQFPVASKDAQEFLIKHLVRLEDKDGTYGVKKYGLYRVSEQKLIVPVAYDSIELQGMDTFYVGRTHSKETDIHYYTFYDRDGVERLTLENSRVVTELLPGYWRLKSKGGGLVLLHVPTWKAYDVSGTYFDAVIVNDELVVLSRSWPTEAQALVSLAADAPQILIARESL